MMRLLNRVSDCIAYKGFRRHLRRQGFSKAYIDVVIQKYKEVAH